ncbi:unnamed protein product [Leptidea sinapis]|uniref:Uncharacterized protein n=1 Tax=Leptidea sinapis TaxID=189913 RepID=A0A5E4R626_9NEOP|nr:unnamed protein product [Leptidea sinapis]
MVLFVEGYMNYKTFTHHASVTKNQERSKRDGAAVQVSANLQEQETEVEGSDPELVCGTGAGASAAARMLPEMADVHVRALSIGTGQDLINPAN